MCGTGNFVGQKKTLNSSLNLLVIVATTPPGPHWDGVTRKKLSNPQTWKLSFEPTPSSFKLQVLSTMNIAWIRNSDVSRKKLRHVSESRTPLLSVRPVKINRGIICTGCPHVQWTFDLQQLNVDDLDPYHADIINGYCIVYLKLEE